MSLAVRVLVACAAVGAIAPAAGGGTGGGVRPTALRVNFLANSTRTTNALRLQAVESGSPDFSWQLEAAGRGEMQTAFQLQVSSGPTFAPPLLCDTGRVASNQTLCLRLCNVSTVKPGLPIYWRVRAAGTAETLSDWVDGPTVLRGLGVADFTGTFVAALRTTTNSTTAPVRLRATVSLPATGQQIVSAIAYVASPGYYHLYSGGVRVNADTEYGPWPEWNKRVYYDCWNVTELVRNASLSVSTRQDNQDKKAVAVFGLRIGPGTYGHKGAQNFAAHYNASALPLLFELHVDWKPPHAAGSIEHLKFVSSADDHSGGSGDGDLIQPLTFNAHSDPILSSDWYSGEIVDNTLSTELDGWATSDYSEAGKSWLPTVTYDALAGREITPTVLEPIIRVEEIKAVHFASHGGGRFAWGFPQNFGGFAELDVPALGFSKTTLTVQIGEEQDATGWPTNGHGWWTGDGQLSWTLRGTEAVETLRPTFMFMGFQYICVSGWPATMPSPTISSVRGYPTSTLSKHHEVGELMFDGVAPSASIANSWPAEPPQLQLPPVGLHSKLNAKILAGVFHLIVWGQRSNQQSIPSDCPNREKHGWMGDAEAATWSAVANFDSAAIYRSWVRSMLDNQAVNCAQLSSSSICGQVNSIIPPGDWSVNMADASWGLAIGEVPYQVLRQYGDVTLMREAYSGMRAYWQFLKNQSDPETGLLSSKQAQWGDWDAAFDRHFYQPNTMHIGATSSHMRLAQILAEVAPMVGQAQHAQQYRNFLQKSQGPYNAYFQNKTRRFLYVDGVEQTVTLLPLTLGFVPQELLAQAQVWLINDIETTRSMHLSTGAIGTRLLFPYLSSIGRTDLAAKIAAQTTYPSHGYWVTQGATTAWENWSGKPDPSHGNTQPTHNHIFLGSHAGWQYEHLLGIRQPPSDSYGFERVTIAPPLIDSLPAMAGKIATVRGEISLAWAWADSATPMKGSFSLNCTIPPNVLATVLVPVPGMAAPTIVEGGLPVWKDNQFAPGVAGVTSGHAETNDTTVVFTISSGSYRFTTSNGGGSTDPIVSGCNQRLECPNEQTVVRVLYAGLLHAEETDSFLEGAIGTPLRRRYLVAHALEGLCRGMVGCEVGATALQAALHPAVVLEGRELALPVCAALACK